jgi:acetylglutamate kinase
VDRKKPVVLKWGGSLGAEGSLAPNICAAAQAGWQLVCLCGGGPAVSQAMQERGLEVCFVQGLRVTSLAAMGVLQEVFSQQILPRAVEEMLCHGVRAFAIRGEEVFVAVRKKIWEEGSGREVDLGWVGEIVRVQTDPVWACWDRGEIPILSPLARGVGPEERYNVNADLAAAHLASALQARALLYLTNVPGVLQSPGDPSSGIPLLRAAEAGRLLSGKDIFGGMIPKLQGALFALARGVENVWLLDGRVDGAILRILEEGKGPGTQILP